MADDARSPKGSRTLLALASFVVVVAGMKAAAPILVPFLMAVFLSVLCAPALTWLQRRGMRRGFALLVVILGVVLVGMSLTSFFAAEVAAFDKLLPDLKERSALLVDDVNASLRDSLPEWASSMLPASIRDVIDPGAAIDVLKNMLSGVTGMFANAFLILLTAIFILLEAASFRAKLTAASETPKAAIEEATEILDNVNRYMGLKTLMSALTGVIVVVWLSILGLEFVVLFGLLAFLLNFVPNLGSILAALPAVLWALVPQAEGEPVNGGLAGLVALGYLGANLLVGNVLEPRLMGRGLGLSTLVVFLSLVFWGWVLGPVGMLLSVPLTASLKIVLAGKAETRWLAILLGSESAAIAAVPHPVSADLQPSDPPSDAGD
ncbi:MAG: membrane protein [Planctomycetota bacterium]|nr:MAG: membrane protein [Planctomycetota bacterium]